MKFDTKDKIKEEHQRQYNELMERAGVFWAFSNEQFEEGRAKHPLDEGEKYVSIGMGGYLRKSKLERFKQDIRIANEWMKLATSRLGKEERDKHILYELNNYEAFYTGSISDAFESLKDWYTREEVVRVFQENYDRETEAMYA